MNIFQSNNLIHLVFVGFVALFPVVNPIGSAFIINPYLAGLSKKERLSAVKKITLYAFIICVATLALGHWVLELFGLSIPVIRVAGGIMICKIGWDFLSDRSSSSDKEPLQGTTQENHTDIDNKLFYPITFPITTGAGSIAVLFTLSAHSESNLTSQYLLNTMALVVSVIIICILIFIFYLNTSRIISRIGSSNEKIINRFMAFLIFCVGLQIAFQGIIEVIKTNFHLS